MFDLIYDVFGWFDYVCRVDCIIRLDGRLRMPDPPHRALEWRDLERNIS